MTETTFDYPFSRGRLILFGFAASVLAVPAGLGAVHFALARRPVDAVILGAATVIPALLLAWIGRRLVARTPALSLRDDYLIEDASVFAAGRLERENVAGARAVTSGVWRLVVIDLHDRERYLAGVNPLKRFVLRFATGPVGPVAIPVALLGDSSDGLAAEIRHWAAFGRPRT